MAKQSMIEREKKRQNLVNKYKKKREEILNEFNQSKSYEEKLICNTKLQKHLHN